MGKNKESFPPIFHRLKSRLIQIKKEFSPNPRSLLPLLFFSLLLILFPANLARHFVLPESYILGLLVDYLTPALYLTEILVVLILISSWPKPNRRALLVFLLFLLLLLPSLGIGLITPLGWVSSFRFAELTLWFLFASWVSQNLPWERFAKFVPFLGLGVLWVSLLALAQFLLQRSVLGYWFLGEPVLFPSLGGVARGSLGGVEILRAYGTFPHPNALGGILSVLALLLLAHRRLLPALAGLVGVAVSLSRLAAFSFLAGLTGWVILTRAFGLVLFDPTILGDELSVIRRGELLSSAAAMVQQAPLTGLGLGQFTARLPEFGLPSGPTLFLQPVHNVFALVAAESGILPALGLALLFLFALRETVRKRRWLLLVALLQLLLLGSFDHYLYTSPQGLFLSALIFGLAFS